MIRFELLDDRYEPIWDDLVASFEEGGIFHTWAWMRVIENLYHAEQMPFGIFDGPDMIGVFPLFRLRRGPLTILASPLGSIGYGGPLVDKLYHRTVMEQLDGLLKRLGADYVELRLPERPAPETLTDRHYTLQELQTYVLSLNRSPQELWMSLERRCRTAIRKAQKNDIQIVEGADKSFLNVYYEMAKDTYRKSRRRPPYSQQEYSAVWDILRAYGRIKVLLASYEGKVIAGALILHFRSRLYGWERAGFRAYYSLNANNLLDWALIEWGASNGMLEYDMMGANIPSIAGFKKSFGGELRTYTCAYKDVSWQASLGRRLYLWLVPRMRRIQYRLRPT